MEERAARQPGSYQGRTLAARVTSRAFDRNLNTCERFWRGHPGVTAQQTVYHQEDNCTTMRSFTCLVGQVMSQFGTTNFRLTTLRTLVEFLPGNDQE